MPLSAPLSINSILALSAYLRHDPHVPRQIATSLFFFKNVPGGRCVSDAANALLYKSLVGLLGPLAFQQDLKLLSVLGTKLCPTTLTRSACSRIAMRFLSSVPPIVTSDIAPEIAANCAW